MLQFISSFNIKYLLHKLFKSRMIFISRGKPFVLNAVYTGDFI